MLASAAAAAAAALFFWRGHGEEKTASGEADELFHPPIGFGF